MKRTVPITLLALLLLFAGCRTSMKPQTDPHQAEDQHAAKEAESVFRLNDRAFWSLGETLDASYIESSHTFIYVIDGETCYLTATKSKKAENHIPDNALEHQSFDGRVLCAVEQTDKISRASSVSYVYYDGAFCYAIGNRDASLDIREHLSLQDAYALLLAPARASKDITMIAEEWSFYSMLPTSNLSGTILCNDGGRAYANLQNAEERTENGVSYRLSSDGETLAYTDGTDSLTLNEYCFENDEHTHLNPEVAKMLLDSLKE